MAFIKGLNQGQPKPLSKKILAQTFVSLIRSPYPGPTTLGGVRILILL